MNGGGYSGQPIHPLDDVALTGADSTGGTADRIVERYSWTIIEKPTGSAVILTDANAAETRFFAAEDPQVDIAGHYRVGLMVADDVGSNDDCEVSFDVTSE